MNFKSEIILAIRGLNIIEFTYKGNLRRVEPHALGYNARGIGTLCGWQLSGGSGEDWRDFHVDIISNLVVTEGVFDKPRDGFNSNGTNLSTLLYSL